MVLNDAEANPDHHLQYLVTGGIHRAAEYRKKKNGSRIDCPKGAGLYRCLSPGAWKKVAAYPFNQSLSFRNIQPTIDMVHEHRGMEP